MAPGTFEEYADSNDILLALIIERVTGEPFTDYIEKTILRPNHLGHTMFYGDRRLAKMRVAKGFVDGAQKGDAGKFPLT